MATGDSFQRRTIDRNRLNQRNFRARRQAYVQELEQRVRKLENEGVRASKEVQVAAQQVHKENRFLRWLLETQFGVNAHQISKYLSEVNYSTDVCTQRSLRPGDKMNMSRVSEESVSSLILTTNPEEPLRARATQDSSFTEPTSAQEERQQDVGVGLEPPEHEFRSPATSSRDIDALQSVQVESHIRLFSHESSTTLETPPPTGRQPRDGRCETGLGHSYPENKRLRGFCATSEKVTDPYAGETSCEEAARIIASLRGHNTGDDVWNELGCGTRQSCRVKNLSVFELMDKE